MSPPANLSTPCTLARRFFSSKLLLLFVTVLVGLEYLSLIEDRRLELATEFKRPLFTLDLSNDMDLNNQPRGDIIKPKLLQSVQSYLEKHPDVLKNRKCDVKDNSSTSINATVGTLSNNQTLCPLIPPGLQGPIQVLLNDEVPKTFHDIEVRFPQLSDGGSFKPTHCKTRHKVAIIVPYRDREEHLRAFLVNIHAFLSKQNTEYTVFIVEQFGSETFNRAMLMNVGAAEALKRGDFQCFVFHDVDLLPEDDRNLYTCPIQPRHMSVAIDTFMYRLPYDDIFGGVSAMSVEHFKLVNGFSNLFWGWGGEDDDMSNRLRQKRLYISRLEILYNMCIFVDSPMLIHSETHCPTVWPVANIVFT